MPSRNTFVQCTFPLSRFIATLSWAAFLFCAMGGWLFAQNQKLDSRNMTPVDAQAAAIAPSCFSCHADIVRSYSVTAMARASGPAREALIPGEFLHSGSGVRYRIFEDEGKAWLGFERQGKEPLRGQRELLYFIGSGHRGRTYLFAEDGYVFESPVNWYAQTGSWDMTPAYRSAKQIPLNLPTATSCLYCHTSGFRTPAPGTENKYAEPLFQPDGIRCERCHGDGAPHAANHETVRNPDKLSPVRRDAICMQCHLEGNVAIEQPGRHLYDFKPGDDLGDFVHYLVLETNGKRDLRAVSQFEALAESMCKRKSGDALHCTTCHDPHSSPRPEQRVAFYRSRCLQCHGESFGRKHHDKTPDCASCHMPGIASSDVAHTQATDHRILRRPNQAAANAAPAGRNELRLVRFPPEAGTPTDRDLVLGWLALAEAGNAVAGAEGEKILAQALKEYPQDSAILSVSAYNELLHKHPQTAKELYESALRQDPLNADAAVNLGVLEAQHGSVERALMLWKEVFQRVPWRSSVGMNLARASCNLGSRQDAEAFLRRVLQFNPDSPEAAGFLRQIEVQPAFCASPASQSQQ